MLSWRSFRVYILKHRMIYVIYKMNKRSFILAPFPLKTCHGLNYASRHKDVYGNGGTAPRTFNLDCADMYIQLHGLFPLLPRKTFLVPTGEEAGLQKSLFCPYTKSNADVSVIQHVAWSLYWPKSPWNSSQLHRKNNGWRQCCEPSNRDWLATHHSCWQRGLVCAVCGTALQQAQGTSHI
jgi:hypothetical protein